MALDSSVSSKTIPRSKIVKEWFQENEEFEVLPWSAKAQDLNLDASNATAVDELWVKVSNMAKSSSVGKLFESSSQF